MPPPTTVVNVTPAGTIAPSDADSVESRLSPQQWQVLRGVMSGQSLAKAARDAGVSRSTVYRWHQEPDFQAALERWRRQTYEASRHRLLALTDIAIDTLKIALHSCDTRAAVALLKGTGVLTPPPKQDKDAG